MYIYIKFLKEFIAIDVHFKRAAYTIFKLEYIVIHIILTCAPASPNRYKKSVLYRQKYGWTFFYRTA